MFGIYIHLSTSQNGVNDFAPSASGHVYDLQYFPFLRAPKELWAHPENDWQVEQTD